MISDDLHQAVEELSRPALLRPVASPGLGHVTVAYSRLVGRPKAEEQRRKCLQARLLDRRDVPSSSEALRTRRAIRRRDMVRRLGFSTEYPWSMSFSSGARLTPPPGQPGTPRSQTRNWARGSGRPGSWRSTPLSLWCHCNAVRMTSEIVEFRFQTGWIGNVVRILPRNEFCLAQT